MKYLLGLDQGTSGTKAYIMDEHSQRIGLGYVPTELIRVQPGWIEQVPCTVAAGAAETSRAKALAMMVDRKSNIVERHNPCLKENDHA
ncbi:MAG TPA: hypothetical protein VFF59_06290 [Anaerolineae bacterium]|nr:hypothetical protein [Anaerolineae bacterium]